MSFLTGTQFETINAQSGAGAPVSNIAANTVASKSPGGAAFLPSNFFSPAAGAVKGLKYEAYGIITSPASSQSTVTLAVYADTTQGTAGTSLGGSGAFTPTVSASSWFWKLDALTMCTATGASGTWLTMGMLLVQTSATGSATAIQNLPFGSTTAVTLSTESAYYLELWCNQGTQQSTTSVTCEFFNVYGIN